MELPENIINKVLDDIYENVIKGSAKSLTKSANSLDIFRKNRKHYFDSLYAQHGHIRILGMSSPMPTEALYIPIQVSEEIRGRQYLDNQYLNYINKKQKIPSAIKQELTRILQREKSDAIQVIEEGNCFILLGGPGGGKTTLLRYLALAYCGKIPCPEKQRLTPLFPIFISLRDISDQKKTLEQILQDELLVAKFPEPKLFLDRLLENGTCILLIDGLDEIPPSSQKRLAEQLRKFVGKYHKVRVIISSRIAEPLRQLESFAELQICDFDIEQIVSFTTKWFTGTHSKKGKKLAEQISREVHLRELATTPLLLSLICILFKHDLRIPTNRSELYERCVECLLREWDSSRGFRRETKYERFSDARKIQFFSQIAYHFFRNDMLLFPKQSLLDNLGTFLEGLSVPIDIADNVLHELMSHHGLIIERAPSIYSFSHLTFQEFFVAKYLVSINQFDKLAEFTSDPKWKEVISLVACMILDGTEFVTEILKKIDKKKLKLLAEKRVLGYETTLLRALALSELSVTPNVRENLYTLYLKQHLSVYPINWLLLDFSWRYSPKPGKTMINMDVSGTTPKKKERITENISSFRYMLDTLILSPPLFEFYEKSHTPNDKSEEHKHSEFTKMARNIINTGGRYEMKL